MRHEKAPDEVAASIRGYKTRQPKHPRVVALNRGCHRVVPLARKAAVERRSKVTIRARLISIVRKFIFANANNRLTDSITFAFLSSDKARNTARAVNRVEP